MECGCRRYDGGFNPTLGATQQKAFCYYNAWPPFCTGSEMKWRSGGFASNYGLRRYSRIYDAFFTHFHASCANPVFFYAICFRLSQCIYFGHAAPNWHHDNLLPRHKTWRSEACTTRARPIVGRWAWKKLT